MVAVMTLSPPMFATKISPHFIKQYKEKTPPWGPIGYVTYKRSYARRVEGEGRTEEWYETVARACQGLLDIGAPFTIEEIELLYDSMFNLRGTVSGRALWQLGTPNVQRFGGDSLNNCWNVSINDPIDPFCFLFEELMLGGGVGFSITPEHVFSLPVVKHNVNVVRRDEHDVGFIVPDNREGWIELLRRTLEAFFFKGKSFSYSVSCIRDRGAAIRGFGGTASGPEKLCEGIQAITLILKRKVGRKLDPVDCLDICNIIGDIVVAGNVRRSSQIALGDYRDLGFLEAKNWGKGTIPNWRSMSNNSVVTDRIDRLPAEYWQGYEGGSEAYGLVNLTNGRRFGRLADGLDESLFDPTICGVNPCSEIFLAHMEACNLAEIFLPNLRSPQELTQVALLLYKACKSISNLPYLWPQSQAIIHHNRRIGIGVTGLMQTRPAMRSAETFDETYRALRETDEAFSMETGVNKSVRLTTCKPSGTLSLLPGVTSGVHPAFAPYYLRRVRFDSDDPLVETCKKNGVAVEPLIRFDGSRDLNTIVASFPVEAPKGALFEKDVTAIQQLETVKFMQTHWADNSVSCTVYYAKDELPAIQDWLKLNYRDGVKAISFCLRKDHGFVQAPHEEITEAQFNELSSKYQPVTKVGGKDDERTLAESVECTGGVCPIR